MDGLKAEKISLAKKKLKEFELRRNRENGFSPTPSGNSSTYNDQIGSAPQSYQSDPNGRASTTSNHSANLEQPYAIGFDGRNGIHTSDTIISIPSTQPTACPSSSNLDVENLRAQLEDRDQALRSLSKQLEELNGYYAQLHAAYSELSSRNPSTNPSGEQIGQLQAALSGLVAEKTGLQSELRNTKEELEHLRNELDRINSTSLNEKDRSSNFERELMTLKRDLDDKNRLLEKRLEELDSERRESARIQTQMLTLQHDRNEAQARLKNIYRDKETLESELKNLRKECQMKDLHIMQLSSHNSQRDSTSPIANEEWSILQAECEKFRLDAERLSTELVEAKKEVNEARTQYNEYGTYMNENIARLNKELDESSLAKHLLETRLTELENQLELAQQELAEKKVKLESRRPSPSPQGSPQSLLQTENEMRKIDDAVRRTQAHWEQVLEQTRKEYEDGNKEKDRLLFERETSIAELQLKLRLAEENGKVYGDASTELLSLSEQLQAEKATVSRAVAQNRELKEQLIATEDRLIALTEEKCASELARQTAEHQVKEFQKQLEQTHSSRSHSSSRPDLENETKGPAVVSQPEPSLANDPYVQRNHVLNDDEVSIASEGINNDSEELRNELQETKRQLDEVRAELRRSHTQNEQMNQIMRQNAEDENQNSILVELGQAIARVNALAHENETLREQVENLRFSQSNEQNQQQFSSSLQSLTREGNALELEAATTTIYKLRHENEDLSEKVNHLTRLLNEAHSQRETKIIEEFHQKSKINIENTQEVGSMEWARIELEKRFAESMRRLAEMQEQCDRVEHINQQLQLENETIADHVVLYQHQRRLIRERLRLKDEQMAALEKERERVVTRCNELQQALVQVLGNYRNEPPEFRPRLYSHSTVDEFSGDEECIVDSSKLEDPANSQPNVHNSPSISPEINGKKETRNMEENLPTNDRTDREDVVKKIMDIIDDIKKPSLPLTSIKMQCKQCIGPIQHL